MRRFIDVLVGIVIGIGVLGWFDCFTKGVLTPEDLSFHVAIILGGIVCLFFKFK